jgi:hypothetical protein
MISDDYNIKPVESLQNIANIDPAKHRQKRKKQQNSGWQDEYVENEITESTEDDNYIEPVENNQDKHSIDYHA